MDAAAVLLRTAIFRDVTRRDAEELVPCLRSLSFVRGEVVWSEGEPAEDLYVVVDEQLKAYRVSRDGVEVVLEVVSSGEVTGEPGLFHPSRTRYVCVSAMAPTLCLAVPRQPLVEFMTRHPPAMQRMLDVGPHVAQLH